MSIEAIVDDAWTDDGLPIISKVQPEHVAHVGLIVQLAYRLPNICNVCIITEKQSNQINTL